MENQNFNHGNVNIETIVYNQIEVQKKLGLKPKKILLSREVFDALSKSVLVKKGLNPEDFQIRRFAKLEIEVCEDVRDLNFRRGESSWSSPIQILSEVGVGNLNVALANLEEGDSELYAVKSESLGNEKILKEAPTRKMIGEDEEC